MRLIDELARRWAIDAASLPRGNEAAFEEIAVHYGEAHRRYHGLMHLKALFSLLDSHVPRQVDRLPLHFALWWHDAIYVPGESSNEERSAALSRLRLGEMGAAARLCDQVNRLILATRNHWEGDSMGDGDYFLDADIAILGAPAASYERYAADVRTEYAHLEDDTFRAGRAAFLSAALGRPHLFRTQAFRLAFDHQARANMAAELARLSSG